MVTVPSTMTTIVIDRTDEGHFGSFLF